MNERSPEQQHQPPDIDAIVELATQKFWAWTPDPDKPAESFSFLDAAKEATDETMVDEDVETARQTILAVTYRYPDISDPMLVDISPREDRKEYFTSWFEVARELVNTVVAHELGGPDDEPENDIIKETDRRTEAARAAALGQT